MPTAGLKTIIALSFVLAVGFLLVILSCAIFHNYHPLLVVATYVLAPAPNWICGRCANPDDFVESSGAAVLDLGRFFTGFFVLMGMGKFLFLVLAALDLGVIYAPRCARSTFLFWTLRSSWAALANATRAAASSSFLVNANERLQPSPSSSPTQASSKSKP